MNILGINVGTIVAVKDGTQGAVFQYIDIGNVEKMNISNMLTYRRVYFRDILFCLLGSCDLNVKQVNAINKIYDEYKHNIDFSSIKDYIINNGACIIPTNNVEAVIKLFGLIEYACNYCIVPLKEGITLSPEVYKGYLKFNFMPLRGITDVGKNIFSKLKMSVFKKKTLDNTKPASVYQDCLYDIIRGNYCLIPQRDIASLFGFAFLLFSKSDNVNAAKDLRYSYTFFGRDLKSKRLADSIINEIRNVKMTNKNIDKYLSYDVIKASKKVADVAHLEDLVGAGVLGTVLISMENMFNLTGFNAYKLILNVQYMNNVCGVYNLSLDFLSGIENKRELLEKSIYLAANFNFTEEDIKAESINIYFKLALLEFIKDWHFKNIENVLNSLVYEYKAVKEYDNLNKELEYLKLKVSRKNNRIKDLESSLASNNNGLVFKEYESIISRLNRKIEVLELKLDESKVVENEDLELNSSINHNVVDLKSKKILIIGHPLSEYKVNEISDRFSKCVFMDGTIRSNDINKESLQGYDYVFLQWEFIPHTVNKITALASKYKIPVCRLDGTNIDKWLNQIEDWVSRR